jgi:hypothetical protein
MDEAYRQEVFNVVLAQLLQERGLVTAPESIIKLSFEEGRRMPDVIVSFNGLRTVIEGEIDKDPGCRTRALESASKRVEEAIAHIGIAIIYPEYLRPLDFKELKNELSKANLDMAIISEAGSTGFVIGDLDYLKGALNNTFEQLVREDIVSQAVAVLDANIGQFARALVAQKGSMERVVSELGIGELPKTEDNITGDTE